MGDIRPTIRVLVTGGEVPTSYISRRGCSRNRRLTDPSEAAPQTDEHGASPREWHHLLPALRADVACHNRCSLAPTDRGQLYAYERRADRRSRRNGHDLARIGSE